MLAYLTLKGPSVCGLYYNQARVFCTKAEFLAQKTFLAAKYVAYLDYDRSYARSSVIVQATGDISSEVAISSFPPLALLKPLQTCAASTTSTRTRPTTAA